MNEPLTFINFVAAFPVGSTIEGEVVSFTSHGAMVDVPLPGGGAMHCYIPLTAMGTPPPTKARQVLKKGEVRPFVLAGLDPPRRVAELAHPTRTATAAEPPAKTAAAKEARAGGQAGAHHEGRAADEEGRQEGGGQEGGGQEGGRAGEEGGQEGRGRGQEGAQEGRPRREEGAGQEGRPRRRPGQEGTGQEGRQGAVPMRVGTLP